MAGLNAACSAGVTAPFTQSTHGGGPVTLGAAVVTLNTRLKGPEAADILALGPLLAGVAGWHVTSEEEAAALRLLQAQGRLRPGVPVAVVPNGVRLPAPDAAPSAGVRAAGGRPLIVLLGRVHPVKNLELAIDSLGVLRALRGLRQLGDPDAPAGRFEEAELVIAGSVASAAGLTTIALSPGEFDVVVDLPPAARPDRCRSITLTAARTLVPSASGVSPDSRRLAYVIHGVERA